MDTVDYGKLLDQLIRIEGTRLACYRDAAGNLIVCPGHYVDPMGVRGNRMAVLEVDVRAVARELEELWPPVRKLDAVRKRVLIHMAFNMEVRGLLPMMRFLSAVDFHLWDTAADEMLISEWAKKSAGRATLLADMIRTGRESWMDASQTTNA